MMLDFLKHPWPWWVAGAIIGLMVPTLLLLGNKTLGISSTLRHICAAVIPAGISYFKYDWKKETWNLFFAGGILAGGWVAGHFLQPRDPVELLPVSLFNWSALTTLRGWILMVFGGFLVGFGTRYADGCTSGHSIMGLSTLQWPSLVATICFMAGGFFTANVILPFILKL